MRHRASVVAATLVTLTFAGACGAATIHVPGDVPRIELALLGAAPHDTILVAPGVYSVSLEWPATAGIKLLSEAGPNATILDGGGIVQVIGIYTGVDTTTVVAGFTIRNGHAEGQ